MRQHRKQQSLSSLIFSHFCLLSFRPFVTTWVVQGVAKSIAFFLHIVRCCTFVKLLFHFLSLSRLVIIVIIFSLVAAWFNQTVFVFGFLERGLLKRLNHLVLVPLIVWRVWCIMRGALVRNALSLCFFKVFFHLCFWLLHKMVNWLLALLLLLCFFRRISLFL